MEPFTFLRGVGAALQYMPACGPGRKDAAQPAPAGTRHVEHLAVQDPRVPRLRSVPSVGPVTAFLAAIDDAQRFRHAHQLEAYLGLVPREYSSGAT